MRGIKTSILAASLLAFAGNAGAIDLGVISRDGGYEYRHPSAWEKEQQRVKDELAAAQRQLADRERDIATLRSNSSDALRSAQAEIDRSKTRIGELDKELASLRGSSALALQSAKGDVEQSKKSYAEIERQLGDRDRELYSLRSSSETALQSAQTDLERSKTRIGELEREIASLQSGASDASKLAGQLSSAQGDLDQSKARAADLERQLAASQAQAAGLQAGAGDKDKLAADLTAANQRVAALESALADRDKELAGLRGDLSAEMAKLKEAQRGLIKALRPQIEKGTIMVDLNNERLLINLASGYLFGSGEDQLKPAGADALKQVGAILKDFPEYKVAVDGHTDNQAIRSSLKKKFPTNKELSEARAANAAKALTEGGLSNATVAGYADSKPVEPNTTAAGRAKNRRVEVRVTK
jgi:chemotaxis protein MotB